MNLIRRLFLLLVIFNCTVTYAMTSWKIVPGQSELKFTAYQNNTPVVGKFKTFSGEINFDPNNVKESDANIVIDIASLSTSYKELEDMLRTAEWFDEKVFPQAVFRADDFTQSGPKTYRATGTLKIRDKEVATVVSFTLLEYSSSKAKVQGNATIKRTMFDIGQGEWENTEEIKDNVEIGFTLIAVPQ